MVSRLSLLLNGLRPIYTADTRFRKSGVSCLQYIDSRNALASADEHVGTERKILLPEPHVGPACPSTELFGPSMASIEGSGAA